MSLVVHFFGLHGGITQILYVRVIGSERGEHALEGDRVILHVGLVTEYNAGRTASVCANKAEGDVCVEGGLA